MITERQKLMADQIKIRRRQCKDTLMKLKKEKIAAVAAAAVENFGNLQSNSTTSSINAVANELIQQSYKLIPDQQTIHQQLLPSFLSTTHNQNETNQQQLSYLNTLNLLCKKFFNLIKLSYKINSYF